jgi:hypothetical protein
LGSFRSRESKVTGSLLGSSARMVAGAFKLSLGRLYRQARESHPGRRGEATHQVKSRPRRPNNSPRYSPTLLYSARVAAHFLQTVR